MFKNYSNKKRVSPCLINKICVHVEFLLLLFLINQISFIECETSLPYLDDQNNIDSLLALKEDNLSTISIEILQHDLKLSIGELINLTYTVSPFITVSNLTLSFNSTNNKIINYLPSYASVDAANYTQQKNLILMSKSNGYSLLTVKTTMLENETDLLNAYTRISIHHSSALDYLSDIVGWTYFFAWSISFYPQTILNWKRKSVIGLHFDFLALNTVGFLVYSLFNIGLYSVHEVKIEYFKRHPFGVNPVQLNDVIFSIHAFFACIIQVVQCVLYERGDQKVSRTGRTLIGSFTIISIVAFILGTTSVISWIDFLYFLSYIKLFITLIKYIPQVYYNYLRKSTSGWSIGNILLDMTGGILSICQMFIISYNYNDWDSIFGDPTKFGLGLFSILFDIFFVLQHYVLYKDQEAYVSLPDSPTLSHSSSTHSPRN